MCVYIYMFRRMLQTVGKASEKTLCVLRETIVVGVQSGSGGGQELKTEGKLKGNTVRP